MTEIIYVNLCGPVLSHLLFENARSQFDQEGFLLGQVYEKHEEVITDHDQKQVNVHKVIQVIGLCACPQTSYFYNGAGEIEPGKIKSLLGDQHNKIVGWYKFKRASAYQFTFRDKIVHKQLANLFKTSTKGLFPCCLSTTESSDNKSTHTFKQAFFKWNTYVDNFDEIPMHVINLSDPNNDYKCSGDSYETFNAIVRKLNLNMEETDGLTAVTKIQNAAQEHLDKVIDELSEAEANMYMLEKEVQELQEKVRLKNYCIEKETLMNEENEDELNLFSLD